MGVPATVFNIELKMGIWNDDVDDVIGRAIEGGISYWCDKVTGIENYSEEDKSKRVSRGGELELHNMKNNMTYTLTKENFINGIKLFMKNTQKPMIYCFWCHAFGEGNVLRFDIEYVRKKEADMIIQYALFGKIKYENKS